MTPRLQTRKDGTGDCVRACIASLLNLTVEEVPDWHARDDATKEHESGYEIWYLAMQQWLAGKGYFFLELQLTGLKWMPLPYEAFAIFIGTRETEIPNPDFKEGAECTCVSQPEGEHWIDCPTTKTIIGRCLHAIVGKCEGHDFFPIMDPLGGNPLESFAGGKIQAVCFLVPIDPALQVEMGKAMDKTIRLARQLPFSEVKNTILDIGEQAFGLAQVQLPGTMDPSAERGHILTPGDARTAGGLILPNG